MLLSLNVIEVPQFAIASSKTVCMFTALPTPASSPAVPMRRSLRYPLLRWSVHEIDGSGVVGARMWSHVSANAAHRSVAELNAVTAFDVRNPAVQFVVVDRRRNVVVPDVATTIDVRL